MSLKTATLILALVAYSTAFILNAHGNYYNDLPRIAYKKDDLSLHSVETALSFHERLDSRSDWSFTSGDGSATITQKISFSLTWGTYEVFAYRGDVSADGYVSAMLAPMNFTFSVTSTGDVSDCQLKYKITPPKTDEGLLIYFTGLEEVEDALKQPAVFKEFKSYVWESLVKVLPFKLKTVVTPYLSKLWDEDDLCAELLRSTKDKFPKPDVYKPPQY